MSTKEEKKTDRGFRLHLRARLRLLKRNLFGSQESGTDEKKTAAPKRGPKAEPRNSGRKKDAKTAPAGKNGARTPETKRQKSKPRNGEGKTASAPAPAKKTRTAKPAVPPMPELTEVPTASAILPAINFRPQLDSPYPVNMGINASQTVVAPFFT